MVCAAFRAVPFTNIKGHVFHGEAATAAAFGRREALVNSDHATSRPFAFVLKLANKFAPACVSYRFRQLRVAEHVFHFQGFDADNLVFVNQSAGQLVQIVHPAIGNFRVESGDF